MKILNAKLIKFGKFKNFSVDFNSGLNVIYGNNESGKSTMQSFIRVMLYGVSKADKKTDMLGDRTRFIPWDEKNAEGILTIEVDGRIMEIRRRFGKTSAGDKFEITDPNTGETIDGYDKDNLGRQLLGMNYELFEKTFCIRKSSAAFSGKDDELASRLMNLQETGDEDISIEKAIKTIDNIKKSIKAPDKRSKSGSLDLMRAKREEKVAERYRLMSAMSQREAEATRLSDAQKSLRLAQEKEKDLNVRAKEQNILSKMQGRYEKWKEIKALIDSENEINNRINASKFKNLQEETVKRAEFLERMEETLDQNPKIGYDKERISLKINQAESEKRLGGILIVSGIVLSVVAVGLFTFNPILLSLLILGVAGIITGILKQNKGKKNSDIFGNELADLEKEQQASFAEREKNHRELLEICVKYGVKTALELKSGYEDYLLQVNRAKAINQTYTSMLGGESIDDLKADADKTEEILKTSSGDFEKDFSAELEKNRQEQLSLAVLIKELESKLSYVFNGDKNPADTQSEITAIDEDIKNLENEYAAADLAAEVLLKVTEKRKSDFSPKVNAKAGEILDILTGKRYKNLRISQEYMVQLDNEGADLQRAEFFSRGTYEQIYFALRMAIGSLIGNGDELMLLDDFLMAYDDTRQIYALKLLNDMAKERQILLFTCHGRDVENAEQFGAATIKLEEDTENVS